MSPRARRPSLVVVLVRGYGLLLRSSPVVVPLNMALNVAQGAVAPVIFASLGAAVARLQSEASVEGPLAMIVVTFTAGQALQPIQRVVSVMAEQRSVHAIRARVDQAVVALPGLAHFDDPEFADLVEVSRRLGSRGSHLIGTFEAQVTAAGRILALSVLVGRIAWWAPLVLLVTVIPEALTKWRGQLDIFGEESDAVPVTRAASYARGLAFDVGAAKEIRVFGTADWLLDRYARLSIASQTTVLSMRRQVLRKIAGPAACRAGLAVAILGISAGRLTHGTLAPGSFAAAALALVALVDQLSWASVTPAALREIGMHLGKLFTLIDRAEHRPTLDHRGRRPIPEGPLTVRFESVAFTYSAGSERVLDGIDLELRAGRSLALVGLNGAGKSTIVRLLCRLYDPDAGRLTLNGIDFREFDLGELRAAMAVDFQDALRFQLDARTNVTAGSLDRAGDVDLVAAATAAAGAEEVIGALPDGWDTVLAPNFGGVDLSEGQWQRIALARTVFTLHARGARIVVFDEPTAALDVRVEQEIVRRFRTLVADRTALLISHRLSTVRLADEIAYLEGGRVVERGSHEELLASGGLYAELWELQARRFRESGGIE